MKNITKNQIYAGVASAAVIAAVIGGLIIAGSPNQERMRRADQQRINDLQQISYAVQSYMASNNTLPPTLDDLARSPDVYIQSVRDPKTGAPYLYAPGTDGNYQLCAVFETDSASGPDQPPAPKPATFWTYGPGQRCYPLQAKPNPNAQKTPPVPTTAPIIQ